MASVQQSSQELCSVNLLCGILDSECHRKEMERRRNLHLLNAKYGPLIF